MIKPRNSKKKISNQHNPTNLEERDVDERSDGESLEYGDEGILQESVHRELYAHSDHGAQRGHHRQREHRQHHLEASNR